MFSPAQMSKETRSYYPVCVCVTVNTYVVLNQLITCLNNIVFILGSIPTRTPLPYYYLIANSPYFTLGLSLAGAWKITVKFRTNILPSLQAPHLTSKCGGRKSKNRKMKLMVHQFYTGLNPFRYNTPTLYISCINPFSYASNIVKNEEYSSALSLSERKRVEKTTGMALVPEQIRVPDQHMSYLRERKAKNGGEKTDRKTEKGQ